MSAADDLNGAAHSYTIHYTRRMIRYCPAAGQTRSIGQIFIYCPFERRLHFIFGVQLDTLRSVYLRRSRFSRCSPSPSLQSLYTHCLQLLTAWHNVVLLRTMDRCWMLLFCCCCAVAFPESVCARVCAQRRRECAAPNA